MKQKFSLKNYKKYTNTVTSIQDLQEEYDRNSALISGRKAMLEKAEAEEAEKKKEYEQIRTTETSKKVAYDRAVEVQNRLKPAYEEAVTAESSAKEEYDIAARQLEEAKKAYDDAVNDEASKEKFYNSQIDIGRDSHNYDFDAILDNLRTEHKKVSLINDYTINNPDIRDYCKDLILYNLTITGYKNISFGEWISNLKGLSGLSYIQVRYTMNNIPEKTNYSCEIKNDPEGRIDIFECDITDMTNVVKRPFFTENDFLSGNDIYQLSLKSIQYDINNAEIAYNTSKTTTDNAASDLEEKKKIVPELKDAYEKAVKNAESIKMNYNTQRAMVNRSKTDYDEAAKVSADAYKVYEEYKAKADSILEEYNRITSTTSSINIEYENARKNVEKILNDIDSAKSNIKKLEEFDSNSVSMLNNAKQEYEEAKARYDEVIDAQHNAAENMPQIKAELDECIKDEEAKKKAMEDALADEMNMRKKIKQTNDDINQIRFRLHEAEEKLSKAQANSDANGRTAESLKLVYDNAKTEYEKANYTYTQSSSICSQLSKVFYKLNYEATRSDYNKTDYDEAKTAYDSALQKFSQLTGMTFNYIDETDSTIDNQQSSKNSEVKEKGLFSKFFGGKKK